ncbi:polysaccharide deacetylase family protein [Desulfospira joergensenii]|uniref:polysaccharide deacetylase family protein n=1 Tax=Desulfospira joergensenii TaxID=53329 RepID=UPI0003B390A8|nr:polysaccharide deacetylase family protein [Desulfospira joergensenii]
MGFPDIGGLAFQCWNEVIAVKFIILMYHMVSEPANKKEGRFVCTPELFRRQIEYLHNKKFNVISLPNAVDALKGGKYIPQKTIVITFDDGYLDTYQNAFPVLLEFGFPATVFVVSSLVGMTNNWIEPSSGIERRLCNWTQLREMIKYGIDIGSHTSTHQDLTAVSLKNAIAEILHPKLELEHQLSKPIDSFAYPYGRFTQPIKQAVIEANYQFACSTKSGFNNHETDPFLLHRTDIFGSDTFHAFKQKLSFGINEYSLFFPFKYYSDRVWERFNFLRKFLS